MMMIIFSVLLVIKKFVINVIYYQIKMLVAPFVNNIMNNLNNNHINSQTNNYNKLKNKNYLNYLIEHTIELLINFLELIIETNIIERLKWH